MEKAEQTDRIISSDTAYEFNLEAVRLRSFDAYREHMMQDRLISRYVFLTGMDLIDKNMGQESRYCRRCKWVVVPISASCCPLCGRELMGFHLCRRKELEPHEIVHQNTHD